MTDTGRMLRRRWFDDVTASTRLVVYACAVAVAILAVGTVVHPGFASASSVRAMVILASFIGFVGAGQMLVVLVGGIDLSMPWVLNAAAIVLTTSSLGQVGRLPAAIGLALGVGAAVGFANGMGVAWLNVPAVVMTLGMNGVLQGLSLGLSKGLTCGSCASYVPEPLRRLVVGQLAGIPAELLVWAGVALFVSVLLTLTTFGRRVYAIGNNPRAAFLAGVPVRAVTVTLYTLSGMFAALAGIALVAYGGQASLGLGDPYLFESIAAVVVGGVSILGGRGNYIGVMAGSVTLVAIVTLLQAKQVPEYGRNIIYGLVILTILLTYGRERAND
ncbi:ABC transporter permease [Virgisporangium aurantiacum]|uniref:Autoinducer 2 import system permease protein LsrD n=1 Tax=Virgisporangium aurantiacum TaxID=175570 RepID=A0A8J3ZJ52_9ACTN|nr:ABC transporter permease [Virgisporangium aurantiacum]GIJ63738.1 sugar ABC transporter permease [Virgisporangium aurantiacum]